MRKTLRLAYTNFQSSCPSPIRPQIDFIKADVRALGEQQPRIVADTVIMNPPFGTRQKGTNECLRVHYLLPRYDQQYPVPSSLSHSYMITGVDMEFLRAAAAIAKESIYSLHKSSTRDHIAKVATKQLGLEAEVIAQLRYDLPNTYSFHRYCSGRCGLQFNDWRGGV